MAHPIIECCAPYPDCPCGPCQDRAAAEALVLLSSPKPCPNCGEVGGYASHIEMGATRTCNGCADIVCRLCMFGARYFCLAVRLPPPATLERSVAVGVQTPTGEEKMKNK